LISLSIKPCAIGASVRGSFKAYFLDHVLW